MWTEVIIAGALGLVVGTVTTPAGVSGAVLLLPLQMLVLGVAPLAATATNLVYNVVAIPGALLGLQGRRRVDWRLARILTVVAVPCVVAGVLLRVTVLRSSTAFLLVAAAVLLTMAALLLGPRSGPSTNTEEVEPVPDREAGAASAVAGVVGGVYGIGGGALVAPWLVIRGHDPRHTAGAILAMTWVTSLVAVAAYLVAAARGHDTTPAWHVALPMAVGGAAGGALGARLDWSPATLRRVLAAVAFAAGLHLLVRAA